MTEHIVSYYTKGWLKRNCRFCKERTKERVTHVYELWTGMAEVTRIPQKHGMITHYSCHDKHCLECKKPLRHI